MTSSYVNPATKEKRKNLVYEIENPFNGEKINHPTHAWKYKEDEHFRHVRENRLWWGNDKNATYPRLKIFLEENNSGLVPVDLWKYQDAGTTDDGGNELKDIFGSSIFDNPKPTKLIERVLKLATGPDSIVLDSFGGSGTTAHAVLKLNAQDGGNRRFILVEMMDYAETITAERVRRVMSGYGEGDKAVAALGGGFEYYTVGEALFDDDGNLNPAVPTEEIRRYVAYSEGIDYAAGAPLHPSFLGVANDAAYFFHYEPERATTLDFEFLATLSFAESARPTTLVIYADNCLLSAEQLKKHGIIFKKYRAT